MPEHEKKQMTLRCPVCFARENDVVLRHNQEGFYCVKCSFTGSQADVLEMYGDLKKKYRSYQTRYTMKQLEEM